MKLDTPEPPKSHRHVKIEGKPCKPSQKQISIFMQLVQSIANRSRADEAQKTN